MSERYFSDRDPVEGRIRLMSDEAHHLARVARKMVGDRITILNGRGTSYVAEILSVQADGVVARVIEETHEAGEWSLPLVLGVAIPKGDRADWLVEKAVEVGVTCLVPLRTERSVVDPRGSKLDRFRKRVVEASKQAGRSRLMEITEPEAVVPWFHEASDEARFIGLPGTRSPAGRVSVARSRSIRLAIGPEGGFSSGEVHQAQEAGWIPVGLGPAILRVETAAIVGCASLAQALNP